MANVPQIDPGDVPERSPDPDELEFLVELESTADVNMPDLSGIEIVATNLDSGRSASALSDGIGQAYFPTQPSTTLRPRQSGAKTPVEIAIPEHGVTTRVYVDPSKKGWERTHPNYFEVEIEGQQKGEPNLEVVEMAVSPGVDSTYKAGGNIRVGARIRNTGSARTMGAGVPVKLDGQELMELVVHAEPGETVEATNDGRLPSDLSGGSHTVSVGGAQKSITAEDGGGGGGGGEQHYRLVSIGAETLTGDPANTGTKLSPGDEFAVKITGRNPAADRYVEVTEDIYAITVGMSPPGTKVADIPMHVIPDAEDTKRQRVKVPTGDKWRQAAAEGANMKLSVENQSGDTLSTLVGLEPGDGSGGGGGGSGGSEDDRHAGKPDDGDSGGSEDDRHAGKPPEDKPPEDRTPVDEAPGQGPPAEQPPAARPETPRRGANTRGLGSRSVSQTRPPARARGAGGPPPDTGPPMADVAEEAVDETVVDPIDAVTDLLGDIFDSLFGGDTR